jgi:predicted metalloprotease
MSGKDLTVFYCPETSTVFVDTAAYERLRTTRPAGADYAMAHLVAAAYGRHVQSTLRVFEDLAQLTAADRLAAERRADLQSTCYAAMWASAAMIEGLFDDPEVMAAIALVEANRDRSILTPEDRTVVPEAFEQGSAEARKIWYDKGYAIPAGGTCALAKIEAAGLL